MRLTITCHCGQHSKTHDLSNAPIVLEELAKVRREKLQRELVRFGRKPPKGKDLGRIRQRAEPTEADYTPRLRAFLRGWGPRTLAMGFEPDAVHFACGSVFRYRCDVTQPLGVRIEDETPPEKRRKPKVEASDGAAKNQP